MLECIAKTVSTYAHIRDIRKKFDAGHVPTSFEREAGDRIMIPCECGGNYETWEIPCPDVTIVHYRHRP